jgi:phenylpropionate dioxygenase-like ring-hydroxylating dioxygenase large terminal subunit
MGVPGIEDFPQIDRRAMRLKPIHLDVWNGFVFLNFDAQPQQSLSDFLGDFATKFGDMPFDGYPHAIEIVQDIEANWKTLVDASNEGYHVNALHRTSLGAMMTTRENPLNNFYDPIFSGPHMSSTTQANPDWRPDAPVVRFVYGSAAYKVQPGLAAEQASAAEGRKTFAEHPMINRVDLPAFSVETTQIFPFSVLQMLTNRYIWFQYWPVGPNRTRAVTRLYGPAAPLSHAQAFAEAHMIAYSRDIMTEDTVVTQLQQIGLRGGGVKDVVLGEHEYMLRFFHEEVLRRTAAG